MIIYQQSKQGFLRDAFTCDIEDVVLDAYHERTGRTVARNEVRSWKESLLAVAKVVNDDAIPGDCGIAVEYRIPQSNKRIDFILTGRGANDLEQLLIIELKQWERSTRTEKDGIVRTRFVRGEADTAHPSYQAWSYATLLTNFNEAVYESDVEVRPCAYLHNYEDDGTLTDGFYAHYVAMAPVFLKGERERFRLREFIKRHVKYGDAQRSDRQSLIYRIENGRIRPSKGLVESLVGLLAGQPEFVLVDDQKVVYESALAKAKEATASSKQVVIIEGGPGTGKSVVAINLLVALTSSRLVAKYVTKNAAPRAVFENRLAGTHRKTQISNLFSGSSAFTETESNVFDTLVVDEAHRLNEKSGLYSNLGDHQIAEIIAASKCAVFFIDEDQRVTWKDIGDKAEIARLARKVGATVIELELTSQFRCNGSDGYLAWLDDALGIRATANGLLDAHEFDFHIFDSPEHLRQEITERNRADNKARMVAGYCWDWKSKKDLRAFDVVIPEHKFAMQWNLSKDGGLWIVAPESVAQIGCIHTCQGLEVDYIGVIVGPDLVVRDGKIVTRPDKRSSHDKSLSGYKKLASREPEEARQKADQLIKNTYRTLMTRGMKGCYVYFTDAETKEYFAEKIVKD